MQRKSERTIPTNSENENNCFCFITNITKMLGKKKIISILVLATALPNLAMAQDVPSPEPDQIKKNLATIESNLEAFNSILDKDKYHKQNKKNFAIPLDRGKKVHTLV